MESAQTAPFGAVSTIRKPDDSAARATVQIIHCLVAERVVGTGAFRIGTTLLSSYGRLFFGAFMPVVESVAPDLGDCNHGGVACLGRSFAEKGTALDPAGKIVSLSPPGSAALIPN